MPTAPLPAGLGLLNLPFDGAVAGSPVAAAGAVRDEQRGAPDGFPALLSDQINNTNNKCQDIDNKECKDESDVLLVLQSGAGTVYPAPPGWLRSGVPAGVSEEGWQGVTPAQAEPGSSALAAEGTGSVLPGGRQTGARDLFLAGADWLGSQLAVMGRERLADPAVALPRAQSAPDQPRQAALVEDVALPTGVIEPQTALAGAAAKRAQPVPGQLAAAPPALDDAKPQLPALPGEAARALPAAAYLRQEQPLPPPDPRAGAAPPASGLAAEPAGSSMPAPRGAVAQSSLMVQTQPREPAAALPTASAVPATASATASSAPVHAGNREVPGPRLQVQTGPAAPAPVPYAAPAPSAPTGGLATSPTERGHEAAPATAWLAAQPAALAQVSSQSSRRAAPHPVVAPGHTTPDGVQSGLGAGATASPLAVSGDARGAVAGSAFSPRDAGLDREAAATALDTASRGTGQPAAGSSMAALVQPRADSTLAPALGQPLQLASAGFADDLGQRILWLSGSNLRSAEIHIDPPELGPLQITVQAHREGTSVHFTTHNTQAREAVEATLPRLRELLEGNGAGTVDVNVAQQQPDARPGEREAAAMASVAPRAARVETGTLDPVPRRRQGLIDDYA